MRPRLLQAGLAVLLLGLAAAGGPVAARA